MSLTDIVRKLTRPITFSLALTVSTLYVGGCDKKNYNDCDTGECCNDVLKECMEDCSGNQDCENKCGFGYLNCVGKVSGPGGAQRGGNSGDGSGSELPGDNDSGYFGTCNYGEKRCRENDARWWSAEECIEKEGHTQWRQWGVYKEQEECIERLFGNSNHNDPEPCTPNCYGKACGSNGCGGSCGNCGNNEYCSGGECIKEKTCEDECGSRDEVKCVGPILYRCFNAEDDCLKWVELLNCQENCENAGYENYRCSEGSGGPASCACDNN